MTTLPVTVLAPQQVVQPMELSPEKRELLTRTYFRGCIPDEVELGLCIAQRAGLDPFLGQICFIKRKDKMVPQITVAGGHSIAARTGEYVGSDDAVFEGQLTFSGRPVPSVARVTVWRLVAGQRCPFTASVRWEERAPRDLSANAAFAWREMPYTMLGKCAEMAALRKAFPLDLSGFYVREELERGEDDAAPPAPAPAPPQRPRLPRPSADPGAGMKLAAMTARFKGLHPGMDRAGFLAWAQDALATRENLATMTAWTPARLAALEAAIAGLEQGAPVEAEPEASRETTLAAWQEERGSISDENFGRCWAEAVAAIGGGKPETEFTGSDWAKMTAGAFDYLLPF